jgi:hypothetical protein
MARYALLILPSANRIYASASVALTSAELEVFSQSVLDGRVSDVSAETIGGVRYVTFAAGQDGLVGRTRRSLPTSPRLTRCSSS